MLERGFDGRWHNVILNAGGSAAQPVELLVTHMPSRDDVAKFWERRVVYQKSLAFGVDRRFRDRYNRNVNVSGRWPLAS